MFLHVHVHAARVDGGVAEQRQSERVRISSQPVSGAVLGPFPCATREPRGWGTLLCHDFLYSTSQMSNGEPARWS